MKKTLAFLLFVLAVTRPAAAQTPQQLTDQIDTLVQQLKGALAVKQVYTAADLTSALATGGTINVNAPVQGNFTIAHPTTISGTGTITPADPFSPTLTITGNDVTVRGITIQTLRNDRETITIGTNAATSAAVQPHRVTLEDITVLASGTGGKRGISLHGVDVTIRRVNVRGFYADADAQAIWINNTPGPVLIEDSFLEASGENILLGGGDPGIPGVIPSDVTIRRNILYKPDNFVTLGNVKNSFEVKNGRRILFDNNLIDGNWRDGQGGSPIVLSVRNQDGACTWCLVDDVTVSHNTVQRTPDGFAVNILGSDDIHPSQQTRRVTIEYNLFLSGWSGFQIGNGVADALIVRHNTLPFLTSAFLVSYDTRVTAVRTPLIFTDNVLRQGEYGMNGGLLDYVAFTGNVIEVHPDRTVAGPSAGNTWLAPGALLPLLDATTFKLLSGTAGY